MKKLIIPFLLITIGAKAQDYSDSTITLTLTQRSAVYVGFYIKQNTPNAWKNRLTPATLKPYVGTGTHLDSVFTVTLKADYITGMISLLLTGQNELTQVDRLSIINNSPSIPGYTALATQIVNLANGNGGQKNTAIYIRDYYNNLVAQLAATRAQIISDVVQWSQN